MDIMTSTSKDPSLYVKATSSQTNRSKCITLKRISPARFIRFTVKAARLGLDDAERLIDEALRRARGRAA